MAIDLKLLFILLDQPAAQTTIQQADEPQISNSIDPNPPADTATPQVYDSPPTAADQETPAPSITNEMSRETGATMNVNDYLWPVNKPWKILKTDINGGQL